MLTRSIPAFVVLIALFGHTHPSHGDDSLPPPFINSLGSHRLFDGKLTLHMLEKGEFVIYKFEEAPKIINNANLKGTSQITTSPSEPTIKKGAKWFVFPVSKDEVWIYEGEEKVTLYTAVDPEAKKESQNNGVFIINDSKHNIIKNAPKEFLARLPKSMRKKYGVEEADIDVLTALGSHHFFKGRLSIELIEKNNMIDCRIKYKLPDGLPGFVETGPVKPGFEKEAKWFVYPRSEDEVWTFDGRDHLILIILGEGHPENVSWHQLASAVGANGRQVPEKVKERLPVGFLDKPEEK
jgi:hypothetical protein